jgi:hypothetical protein
MTTPYALHFEGKTPEEVRAVMRESSRRWLEVGNLILPEDEDEIGRIDDEPPIEKSFPDESRPFENATHLYDLLRFEIFRFFEPGEFVLLPTDEGLLVLGWSRE